MENLKSKSALILVFISLLISLYAINIDHLRSENQRIENLRMLEVEYDNEILKQALASKFEGSEI